MSSLVAPASSVGAVASAGAIDPLRARISVLVPTRDEEPYIGRCIESLISGGFDFSGTGSEILVIDGRSADRTREIVRELAARYPFVRLVDNPKQIQVAALNLGLSLAVGDVIFRCDAHAEYPPNYIPDILQAHSRGLGDNIGGGIRALPGADTREARAISLVMNSKLGVGPSHRTIDRVDPVAVDTVPFGSWRRELFERVGTFDDGILRGEDLDFNVRIRRAGLAVVLLPWLRVRYYARRTFVQSARMFFQYGYWKNFINRKHARLTSARQLAPAALIVGELALVVLASVYAPAALVVGALFAAYLLAIGTVAVWMAIAAGDLRLAPFCFLAFLITHHAYGFGYARGFVEVIVIGRRRFDGGLVTVTR